MTMEPVEPFSLSLRWEHPERQRYYHVVLAQDFFGDWVITKAWGGINKATGRITHQPFQNRFDAEILIQKISKTRLQRGYILRENNASHSL